VRQAIRLKDTDSVTLRIYPRKRSPLESLAAKLTGEEGESSESRQAEILVRMMETVRPIAKVLQSLEATQHDVLAMPEIRVR
jgi:predicted house-cleaning noncanonical NTP pyrophosphatase (MazG superfamily)